MTDPDNPTPENNDAPPAAPPPAPVAQDYPPEKEPVSLMEKAKLPLMVSLLVFIVGILAVGQFGGVSLVTKKDFGANIALMNTAIGEAQSSADAVSGSVEEKLAAIPSTVNTAIATATTGVDAKIAASTASIDSKIAASTAGVDAKIAAAVAGKANQTNLITVTTGLADLATKMAAANTSIESLKTQAATDLVTITGLRTDITALQAQVANLEEVQEEEAVPAANAIEVEVSTMGYALLPSADNTTISTSFRVDLTNTTTAIIEDIVLDIVMDTNVPQADVFSWTLTGGGTIWQSAGYWYSGSVEFMNTQWGLNIAAGATKRLYLTLTVVGTPGVANGVFAGDSYQYQVAAEVLN